MNTLLELAFYLGFAAGFLAVLAGLWRLGRGPTTLDRMIGLDTLTIAVGVLIGLESLRTGTTDYMELIIVITAFGCFTTVAFYYYLSQPKHRAGEDFNQEEKPGEDLV
jgi:multicomponent K+:H+ antiporter subunit F